MLCCVQDARFELLRQKRQVALDALKREAHEGAVQAAGKKLEDYNKLLLQPCSYSLELATTPL